MNENFCYWIGTHQLEVSGKRETQVYKLITGWL